MADEKPKLAVIPRKRGRPSVVKSEIQKRATNHLKIAELEAQKVAIGEMVVERLDELIALLRSSGFKIDRSLVSAAAPVVHQPPAAAAPLPIANPCRWCGQPGVVPGLCEAHRRLEAVESQGDRVTAALMGPQRKFGTRPKTVPQNPDLPPPPPKQVINPMPIDFMKGEQVPVSAVQIFEDLD